jgi:hypothetical protein
MGTDQTLGIIKWFLDNITNYTWYILLVMLISGIITLSISLGIFYKIKKNYSMNIEKYKCYINYEYNIKYSNEEPQFKILNRTFNEFCKLVSPYELFVDNQQKYNYKEIFKNLIMLYKEFTGAMYKLYSLPETFYNLLNEISIMMLCLSRNQTIKSLYLERNNISIKSISDRISYILEKYKKCYLDMSRKYSNESVKDDRIMTRIHSSYFFKKNTNISDEDVDKYVNKILFNKDYIITLDYTISNDNSETSSD